MSAVAVRAGAAGDGPALVALVEALARYERLDPPDAAARERLVADAFGPAPRVHVLFGELDGRAVGYALWFHTYSTFLARPTLYLEDLFVLPEARRHGVGQALLAALGRQAVADGCGRMEWSVLGWNALAQEFYRRLGAAPLDEWQAWRLTGDALARLAGAA